MKRCSKCGVFQSVTGFNRDKSQSDNLKRWCRTCCKSHRSKAEVKSREAESHRRWVDENVIRRTAQQQRWRSENPDYSRQWIADNRELSRSYVLKRRATIRELPGETVTVRMVVRRDGKHCWMCGDEMSEWNPAHLDHLIPVKAPEVELLRFGIENPGTVLPNMALACPPCNIRKGNRVFLAAIVRYSNNLKAVTEHARTSS